MASPRPLEVPDPAHLFAPLHGELLALLRGLSPDDRERPTLAGTWCVRDVAMHRLDGDLRKLSREVLLVPRYLTPLLDTAVRALPHRYREVIAADGAAIALVRVTALGDALWRQFFSALPLAEGPGRFEMQRRTELLESFWGVHSVMV